VPNTSATAASSGADLNGKAAQAAARILRERLVAHASFRHKVAASKVRFVDGHVRIGKKSMPFRELVAEAYVARVSLSSTGYYPTPKIHWDRSRFNGRPFFYFAYGAAVSEVAVDTLSGETLCVSTSSESVHKNNPAIIWGNRRRLSAGRRLADQEELCWNAQGQLQTHAPSTYKIPTVRDWPPQANIRILQGEPNREDTIHRSKAVGEPPLMLCISTFLAIRDAIAACAPDARERPDLQAPATPEAVLAAIDRLVFRPQPVPEPPKNRRRTDRTGLPATLMIPYLFDIASLLGRWLHLITGIAWIGASFCSSARRQPAAAEAQNSSMPASAVSLGRAWRFLMRRNTRLRRPSCQSHCTGSIGKLTRPGCRVSSCCACSTSARPRSI
jgi:hypothetical protein